MLICQKIGYRMNIQIYSAVDRFINIVMPETNKLDFLDKSEKKTIFVAGGINGTSSVLLFQAD